MSTDELLAELARRGIRVWAEEGRLRYDAPAGALDETLRAAVATQRPALLEKLGGDGAPITPIPRDGRQLPLSFGQQRLWFLHQLAPENLAYNVPSTVRLRGPLDVEALTRALETIVARHETLRSRFPATGGRASLVIEPPAPLHLAVESLEDHPEAERLEAAKQLALADAGQPFELGAGPLFRVRLFRLGSQDHVLHAVLHHIISDGWSMLVFFRELAALYRAFLAGEPSPLPPLPVQYADHAWWQQESLGRPGYEADLAWWKQQLAGVPTLELPRDRPRPAAPSHRGAFVWLPIEAGLRDGLGRLSQREGVTRFQAMLAAFYVLLARHCGQDDLVVGTPIAARGRREIEGLIGFFVDNLVLRCDLSGDPSFRELLGRVRGVVLDAFARQDVPFERLVEALRPERELGRNPLFQVLFNHFDLSETEFGLPPLELSSLDMTLEVSKFDLTLHAFEVEGRLIAKLEYDTDLFDRETVEALGQRYLTLLAGVVADPGAKLSRLPLLADAERARLLVQWNRGEQRPPEGRSIHALFQQQARRTPQAPALVSEERCLSYAELEAAASALARRLVAAGVGPEVKVALFLDRSAEMIVALLGVLEAGGAYVPIDISTPAERVAFILDDADCKVLLTRRSLRSSVPDGARPLQVLCVDDESPAPAPAVELPEARPGQLAYVIYTSGSTGQPKGVEVEHAQLLSYLSAIVPRLEVPAGSVFATVSTLAADLGHTSIFPALCGGGCLHVLTDERIGDGAAFADWFARHAVDVLKIVPSHLEALLAAAPRPAEVLPRRLLVLGGEACTWELVERVAALAPGLAVMNHYGPAETTVGALAHRLQPGDRQRFPLRPPLGRPLANAQVYLVDRHLEPVPVGAAGEILIAGGGVSRGYRNRPELLAERFIAHPFRRGAEGRAYRTGDLARYSRDGCLQFLGRADEQVKLRGFRVELGEVRAAIERQTGVASAAVVVRRDPLGVQRIVAYVVPRAGAELDLAELRAALKSQLPDYMVPAAAVPLSALPLTKNGKLDRLALPAADFDRDVLRESYVAPRTPAEQTLARIWCEVLRLPRVGVHDNFFELGGESILSIQIISRANQAGLRLKPKDVFERATIAELAAVAGRAAQASAEQGRVTGSVPLTPIQCRFFEQELAQPWHYNHALLLLVRRPLEDAVLRGALEALEQHHDALRLRFTRGPGGWTQSLADPGAPPLEVVDLAGQSPDERQLAIESRAQRVQASLDLGRGPLWRAVLFRAGGGEPDRLLLVVHHLAVDGVSWRLLLEDLALACEQIGAGRPVVLPPKTSSYKAWAEALATRARSEATLSGAAAWGLDGRRAAPRLPVDRAPRAARNVAELAETLEVQLDEAQTAALLREVPRAWSTQINDVLLTALLRAAEPWTGSPRLLVELEGHGRDEPLPGLDVARTVGWFTAVAPVVLDLAGAADPGEALVAVKERLREPRLRGQGWGLLRWLAPPGPAVDALRSSPAAEIGFNYLGHFEQGLQASGLFAPAPESPGLGTSPENSRRYLLDVGGSVRGGRLHLSFTWCREVHERATIEALAARVVAELAALIAHCTRPGAGGHTPSDFPLARLDRAGLAALESRYGALRIEDIYALSPLQRGMVFHTLAEPGSAAYVTQLALTLHGPLSAARFKEAWQRALDRNPILRSAIVVDQRGEMHQVVCRELTVRWSEEDWSALPAEEQAPRLATRAQADRSAGFDLADPPLMRLALIKLGEQRHRLLWTHHHVLLDGWSLPLLVRDVFAAYSSTSAAESPPRRPFREYIRWLLEQDGERAAQHWRAVLSDWSEPTPLPAGTGADDAGAEGRGVGARAILAHALSEPATAALTAQARRQHVTLNTLVQGAWALLLARHSRRDEVLFGVTISGRPPDLPGVESMLGLFINTLPLRVDTADAPIAAWLARLQQQLIELQQFEASPLFEVQRLAAVPGGGPLFESLVVFENYPVEVKDPVASAGLVIEDAVDVSHATYPLALVAQPGRQLALQLRYDSSRYDAATIQRLLQQLGRLLEGLGSGAATRLSELSLLAEDERARQLETWNDTARPYPRDATVPQLFEEQAARAPQAPAVVSGEQSLSYAELDRRANRLAHRLAKEGVGPGALVAIRLERGSDLVVGLLGILKAGAAYVPLDPEHPDKRIELLLQDSGATALVTRAALAGPPAGFAGPVIALDAERSALEREPADAPPRQGEAGDLAYVVYTSGSTGQPKGVCVPHRGITRLVLGTDYVQLTAADHVAHASNVAFDAATFELWGALLNGGCVVCLDRDTALSPERLAAALREQKVSVLFVTTALFNQLVQAVPEIFATLRCLLFGGEAVDPRVVATVLERGRPARLLHVYGPTECTTYSTWHEVLAVPEGATTVPIGRPIANSTAYVLDPHGQPPPLGAPGELYLGGDGLALGYHRRPALTAERFVPHPFREGERLYRTGDLVRQRADGALEFVGRVDSQIKLRGFRIELGEVEEALRRQGGVGEVVVLCREDSPGDKQLVAYVVPAPGATLGRDALRAALAAELPESMVPAAIVPLAALPLTPNGKIDRRALPAPAGRQTDRAFAAPTGATEQRVAAIWREVLGVELVGSRDNFFDLGGHSLKLLAVHRRLAAELGAQLSVTDLFQHTTVEALARRIDGRPAGPSAAPAARPDGSRPLAGPGDDRSIAIVGMAGRFPGARDIEAFWRNLCDGVESITVFSDEELRAAGVPEETLRDPAYVRARAVLDEPDRFDARFFGYAPREAELMDPQQRLFLECAWEALERAGYDPARHERPVGVFAGASLNSYLDVLRTRPELLAAAGGMAALISSINDFLTTRVSYKLNLHGPSMNVQTACSTSLVAVHEACRSLADGGCDLALAGGVSVTVPWVAGYLHEASGVRSSDGHCRTFDARAEGMVSGNGVAIVVLKRLADALADGDSIHAVIRGTAINNDGSRKVGFTAPSIEGQAEVIARAQEQAGVDPGSIGYVECHGTATALGDPIEVAALTRVFRQRTERRGFCALASLKSNMGHLDAAAGVAGLIKAALAVERGAIPPSLHYVSPNPEIDFASSPFFVASTCLPWTPAGGAPRRAGVSAFGIGGTNAHAVLEQPPALPASGPSRPWQLLQLSARTAEALEAATENLARHLERQSGAALADVAHTLRVGRHGFEHRRAVLCRDTADAVAGLRGSQPERRWTRQSPDGERPVVFLFPGQGSQYAGMAQGLYRSEPVFREELDRCLALLAEQHGLDLRAALFPEGEVLDGADARLTATSLAQPALFCVEYALARLWISWGVVPQATLGHSVGEFVSACLAGVMSLPDALGLVTLRGRLMEAMPRGVMLAVPLAETELVARLAGRADLWLCGINAPEMGVVGGTEAAVAAFERELAGDRIATTRLHTSHAFHSGLMDAAVAPFVEAASRVALAPPASPYVSTLTGDWITAEQATDPRFWARQIREPVRYAAAVARLLEHGERALIEVGPGNTLGSLARAQPGCGGGRLIVSSLRHAKSGDEDQAFLLGALGRLWTGGVAFEAKLFSTGERRRRVALPTYPFERQRYWVERRDRQQAAARRPLDDWFYASVWRPAELPAPVVEPAVESAAEPAATPAPAAFDCLVFGDGDGLERRVVARLQQAGRSVLVARPGVAFRREGPLVTLDPTSPEQARRLVDECLLSGRMPGLVAHLWLADRDADEQAHARRGFFHLGQLARALGEAEVVTPVRIAVVTSGVHAVTGRETLHPGKALALGVCRALPLEQPNLACRLIDIEAEIDFDAGSGTGTGSSGSNGAGAAADAAVERLVGELLHAGDDAVVAWRGGRRWVEGFAPLPLPAGDGPPASLRPGGTYLVTGGLGGMGLALARWLHDACRAQLVLVGRTPLPPRERWDEWLASHPAADATSRRLAGVLALERAGAQVLALSADVADREQLDAVVEATERRFGHIHGVIHAAGVPPAGMLQRMDEARAAAVLLPKVTGTRLLLERLGAGVDFILLCSSLNAIKGFPGAAAYSAANAYLDACARAADGQPGARVVSIGWSRWRESGMAVDAAGGPLPADQGLSDAEGAQVLARVLAGIPGAHVLVSERDLREVLRAEPDAGLAQPGAAASADGTPGALAGAHPRPSLPNEFVAPSTPLEQELAAIWEEFFGIAPIGAHDNFFELGGHSLLAMRVVNRILQRHAGVKLTLRALFDAPTVARLAARLAALMDGAPLAAAGPSAVASPGAIDLDTLEPDSLDTLSDDEVAALLARLADEERRRP